MGDLVQTPQHHYADIDNVQPRSEYSGVSPRRLDSSIEARSRSVLSVDNGRRSRGDEERGGEGGLESYFSGDDMSRFSEVTRKILFGDK